MILEPAITPFLSRLFSQNRIIDQLPIESKLLSAKASRTDLSVIVLITNKTLEEIKLFPIQERSLTLRASNKPVYSKIEDCAVVWGGRGLGLMKSVPESELLTLLPGRSIRQTSTIKGFLKKYDENTYLLAEYYDYSASALSSKQVYSWQAYSKWNRVRTLLQIKKGPSPTFEQRRKR